MIRCHPRIYLCPPPDQVETDLSRKGPDTTAPFVHPILTASLTVITCHFNWQSYERPRQHLHRFLRQMKAQGLPVYGVEAVLPGQVPQTEGMPGWCQVLADPDKQVLFQKEALLNLAEKLVPNHVDKIAFIDADVWMDNPRWAEETALLLDHFPMVQPFARALWTAREGHIVREAESVAIQRQILVTGAHPGFALAARRELWSLCGGLYPWMILGGGDMAIVAPALHLDAVGANVGLGNEIIFQKDADLFLPWERGIREWTQGRMAWARGNCIHEWHGDRKDRAYERRHEMLRGLVTSRHLRLASNGLVEWTDEAPEHCVIAARDYFKNRREDG